MRLVGEGTSPAGAGSSLAVGGLSLLHPQEQVFDAMLSGGRVNLNWPQGDGLIWPHLERVRG